ncbi:MAG: HEAT repeat domain-containing protein [Phycisphaeraceae bacterium]|nr:HEAT repeat domain-containing protein [Phycisphaeraceae bacterium]
MNALISIVLLSLAQHGGSAAAPDAGPPGGAPSPDASPAATSAAALPAPASPTAAPAGPRPIQVPPGFEWDLFAMEPLVSDPVAFSIDELGRVFVAESARQERGVEDNRHQSFWLIDDLSNRTNDDRLRMYEKWAHRFEGGMAHFTRWADRVRVLVDPDDSGRPTRAINFSGDFNEPLDGTNAGVLTYEGTVWVTCIPTLWRFRDTTFDGVADERERVFDGFGVRIALRGHDMHGLVMGPDGRLYWSIGDRGYHLELPDGRVLADPKSGAIFRCELDGSNLEVFCTGLRNPQELAFNRFGDLFTGENNSDAGDRARIVWCVDGAEIGWEMNYQTLEGANQRGPWNQERIWRLWEAGDATDPRRAAWALPPLAHIGSGPSGLVAYPGVGLDSKYDDALFMCDFLGDRRSSRVLAMTLERDGAGYEVRNVHPFVSDVLPTDVDFDFAGRMMISDWDAGWESNGKGQLYRVWDPRFVNSDEVQAVTRLVGEGFKGRSEGELAALLQNPDMRVRLRAQWELASRGEGGAGELLMAAGEAPHLIARLHGIWGCGQFLRTARATTEDQREAIEFVGGSLTELLEDEEPEIRAQVAKVLGEAAWMPALEPLIAIATDEDPRVRFFAAGALGRLGSKEAIPALTAILWENQDENPYLRHAASLALARIGDREALLELAADQFPQVRLGAVLALRRLRDPALARSLFDPERRVATEAARAIHDMEIDEAFPALIEVAEGWSDTASAESTRSGLAPGDVTVHREVWRPIPNTTQLDLAAHPVFDREPTAVETLSEFASPANDGSLYAARLTTTFVPSMSGPHHFDLASDDHSLLYLVFPGDDGERRLLARVQGFVQAGHYDAQPSQRSGPVRLEAGVPYRLEVRHAQGGGIAHCSLRVTYPDGRVEDPLGRRPEPNLDAVPLLRRAIDAALRSGSARGAEALMGIASSSAVPMAMRLEALEALRLFADPVARRPGVNSPALVPSDPPVMRDRVHGRVHAVNLASRDIEGLRRVLSTRLPALAADAPDAIRALARTLAEEQSIALDPAAALATARDTSAPPRERAQCLLLLVRLQHPEAGSLVADALVSAEPLLRMAAREALVRRRDPSVTGELRQALAQGSLKEQQVALAQLASLATPAADASLIEVLRAGRSDSGSSESMAPASGGELGGIALMGSIASSPSLRLDLLDAAEQRRAEVPEIAAALAAWQHALPAEGVERLMELSLEGGDADRGAALVNFHSASACLRCHALDGHGGNAAPALDGVGARLSRRGLLESLIDPNAAIAEGYTAPSAMPEMSTLLTPRELRDIVEYLHSLR